MLALYCLVGWQLEAPHAAVTAPSAPQLTLSLNDDRFEGGDLMILSATVFPGNPPAPMDIYVAFQQPDQTLFFLRADGSFTPEFQPLAAGWTPTPFAGEIF